MANTKRPFEEEWPCLAGALRAWLGRRGFPGHEIDDVVQETGLRLFRVWDQVDPTRSPRGLAYTIANNVLWEEGLRLASCDLAAEVPDAPASHDVETTGMARLELKRVQRALGQMSDSYRAVLLAELGASALPLRSPNAIKMLRMRARKRLATILEGASASAFALVADLKRSWGRIGTVLSRREGSLVLEASGTTVATFVCSAVTVLLATSVVAPAPARGSSRRDVVERTVFFHLNPARPGRFEQEGHSVRTAPPSPDRTRSKESGDPEDDRPLSLGDQGPLHGEADVRRGRDPEDDGLQAPQCSVDRTGEYEVRIWCRIDAGDEEVEGETTVGLRP